MPIIEQRKIAKRVARSFRLRPELVEKIGKIAREVGESQTYVMESLLEYAIESYEKEGKEKRKPRKKGVA